MIGAVHGRTKLVIFCDPTTQDPDQKVASTPVGADESFPPKSQFEKGS